MKNKSDMMQERPFQLLLFVFALLLFGWPFLSMAEQQKSAFLFVYLFSAWMIVILILLFMSRALNHSTKE